MYVPIFTRTTGRRGIWINWQYFIRRGQHTISLWVAHKVIFVNQYWFTLLKNYNSPCIHELPWNLVTFSSTNHNILDFMTSLTVVGHRCLRPMAISVPQKVLNCRFFPPSQHLLIFSWLYCLGQGRKGAVTCI